ncbi:MAG: response regulator [Planctomycetes bacterium]|nr:response regulator [Planctomycetota bacterium]
MNERRYAREDIDEAYVQAEQDLERASSSLDQLAKLLRQQRDKRAARLACKLRRHKIVVADDVAETATLLAKILDALGQDVVVAHDGASTIEAVHAAHCDIAIIDIAMPGMDGYEVARRLRADSATKPVVLIALTGYDQQNDRACAFKAGFSFFLSKPTNVEELENLLQKI